MRRLRGLTLAHNQVEIKHPLCCTECGKENMYERGLIDEEEKGWLVGRGLFKVTQKNGSERYEYLGECPDCREKPAEL